MATDTQPRAFRRALTWIFNPFHYLSGEPTLAFGLLALGITGVVGSLSHIHVDGVLDVHIGPAAPLWFFIAEGLIDWLSLTLFVGIAGLLLSRSRLRLVDIAGMQALARAPQLVAVGLLAMVDPKCGGALFRATPTAECGVGAVTAFAVTLVVLIFAAVWTVSLMYRAFAVACNVRGGPAIGAFVAALILAEVLSKILIVVLIQAAHVA